MTYCEQEPKSKIVPADIGCDVFGCCESGGGSSKPTQINSPNLVVENNGTYNVTVKLSDEQVQNLQLASTALQSETDPAWNTDKPAIQTSISNLETNVTNLQNSQLSTYQGSWSKSFRGTTTSPAIGATEIDLTAILGVLPQLSIFNNPPVNYDSINNAFKMSAIGQAYTFSINIRLSGNITGPITQETAWRVLIRRASDNSVVTYGQWIKVTGASTTITDETVINLNTFVNGDLDPYVTNGFRISMIRTVGAQTFTLSNQQDLRISR